jgi:hypothetical protein
MDNRTRMKRALAIIEKTFIRVGAVLGVVATIILLNSEILKPSPPDIDVSFLLSHGDEINYVQEVSDPNEKHTEAFPLGLVVQNNGGTVAKSVILSLIADQAEIFTFKGLKFEARNILAESGFRPLYRIHLGNVNPDEKVFLDENIWCQTFNICRVRVKAIKNNGDENEVPLSELRVIHDFEVRLSVENAGMKTRNLYLTTGIESQFKEKKKPYYTFQDGKITFHQGDT